MQYVKDWYEFCSTKNNYNGEGTALTIGVFDGVHRGHTALLEAIKRTALRTVVVTFDKNPEELLFKHKRNRINTLRQKYNYLKSKNIDDIIVIDFSHEFSKIRGDVFIRTLIDKLNIKHLCLGQDFRCGYNLDTDIDTISGLFYNVVNIEIVEDVRYKDNKISSSLIRKEIEKGNLLLVNELLGREYCFDFYGIEPDSFEEYIVFPVEKIVQVMPPKGKYYVDITHNMCDFYPSMMRIEEKGVFFDKKNIQDTSIAEVRIKYTL
ncbi:FAD synthetase family protein [Spirochaetia bacterium 38H-sp]|uniref:FAD synthase n=1 Tax=Rarispira pelagica TaxID=3141764 RepID=A0ABU9UAW1_9SPIR